MDICMALGYNDKSKSCDRSRSKIRDRSSTARSYGVVSFSALLGGPEPSRGTSGSTDRPTDAARGGAAPSRMLLPPDQSALSPAGSCPVRLIVIAWRGL
jgi:hypothetical protein